MQPRSPRCKHNRDQRRCELCRADGPKYTIPFTQERAYLTEIESTPTPFAKAEALGKSEHVLGPFKGTGIAGTIVKFEFDETLLDRKALAEEVLPKMPPCKECGHSAAAHEDGTCAWVERGAGALQAAGIEPDWCECEQYVNPESQNE